MTIKTSTVPAGSSIVQRVDPAGQTVLIVPGTGGSMTLEFTTQLNPRINAKNAVAWTPWPYGTVTLPKQGQLLPQVTAIRVTALAQLGTFVLSDEAGGLWDKDALGVSEKETVKVFTVTTDGAGKVLSKNGLASSAGNCIAIPSDSTYTFEAFVAARRADANDESAFYWLTGCIDRNGAASTTALVGSVTQVDVAEDNIAWNAAATADTTLGALIITVTGEAGKTVKWVARVSLTEITG